MVVHVVCLTDSSTGSSPDLVLNRRLSCRSGLKVRTFGFAIRLSLRGFRNIRNCSEREDIVVGPDSHGYKSAG